MALLHVLTMKMLVVKFLKKYVNAHTKIEWECENKHRWFATPHNISRGRWCPECAHKGKKNSKLIL